MEARQRAGVRSAAGLLALLRIRDSAIVEAQRQYAYFNLRSMRDTRDAAARAALDSLAQFTASGAEAVSHALAVVPRASLEGSGALRVYAHAVADDRRSAPIDSRRGVLLRDLAPVATGWQPELYQALIDRARFGFVRQGADSFDVWRQRGAIATSTDRRVRREGFDRLYGEFAGQRDLFAFALIKTVTARDQTARLRGYPDAPTEVYRSRYLEPTGVRKLIADVRGRAQLYQRYVRNRVRFLEQAGGIPAPGPWDLSAPLGEAPRFSLDSARGIMRAALAPLGGAYAEELDSLLDPTAASLDIEPGAHRAGGGTSIGFPGTAVGVYLAGFEGYYTDLSRLVHESGHAMQTRMMARGRVLPAYAAGPNYLGEAVALFNELVVADHLARHAASSNARQFYDERFLAKAFEVVLGAQDAELEQAVYDSVAAGRVTTADDLDSLSSHVLGAYSIWEPTNPQRREQWISARLLYVDPLYLANYLYSGAIALSLFQQYRRDPGGFVPRYVRFLETGYVAPPDTLLARLGVRLSDPALIAGDFDLLRARVDELETLQVENARILQTRSSHDGTR
jgi:oligoendopeptidase F